MRLSEMIAGLDQAALAGLATRVIPGAEEQDEALWPHNLEIVLQQTGHVEQIIFARRPPAAAVLLALLQAPDRMMSPDQVRQIAQPQTSAWCKAIVAGELANRVPEHSRIYRRMLHAAWANDMILDASEGRMLGLLRDELGLLRMEHFLLAHDSTMQPYWRYEDPLARVLDALVEHGVLFEWGHGFALPDELVPHVKRALGLDLGTADAERLYERLDSGRHLKTALADHYLPTSGSKSDRIRRLSDNFIPAHAVLDTMHIQELRDLARSLEVPVTGAKNELVGRVIDHFDQRLDLVEKKESEPPAPEREERALGVVGFTRLFVNLTHHDLHTLLKTLGLRQSGTKEVRVATLQESAYSETTILNKLKSGDLDSLLSHAELKVRGGKGDKITALLDHFRAITEEDELPTSSQVSEDATPSSSRLSKLIVEITTGLEGVELSSTGPARFDEVAQRAADVLGLERDEIGVKYLHDPKNYRNRVGEALRGTPALLLLLGRHGEGDAVLEAARARADSSPSTHFVALCGPQDESPQWRCEGIACARETGLLRRLHDELPTAPIHLMTLSPALEAEEAKRRLTAVEDRLAKAWPPDGVGAEELLRRSLEECFDDVVARVRTKHVSDTKNLGNRISEGIGAGCSALILVVPEALASSAKGELQRQLSMAREPALAAVLPESDAGYGWPLLVGRGLNEPEETASTT